MAERHIRCGPLTSPRPQSDAHHPSTGHESRGGLRYTVLQHVVDPWIKHARPNPISDISHLDELQMRVIDTVVTRVMGQARVVVAK